MSKPLSIVLTSDLHGYLPDLPDCDILLIAGDICPDGGPDHQADWLDGPFRRWLCQQPAKEVVAVAGNHDFVFQDDPNLVPKLPWHYLQDSVVNLMGVNIYGTPWQPVFFDWAFNLDEPALAGKWKLIPDDTQILLLHGPPHGYGDRNSEGTHTGSPSLTRRIRQIKPQLVVCGHIHEARGEYQLDGTRIINASQLNLRYEPFNDVIQIAFNTV